jgi:hypothetical protein
MAYTFNFSLIDLGGSGPAFDAASSRAQTFLTQTFFVATMQPAVTDALRKRGWLQHCSACPAAMDSGRVRAQRPQMTGD